MNGTDARPKLLAALAVVVVVEGLSRRDRVDIGLIEVDADARGTIGDRIGVRNALYVIGMGVVGRNYVINGRLSQLFGVNRLRGVHVPSEEPDRPGELHRATSASYKIYSSR